MIKDKKYPTVRPMLTFIGHVSTLEVLSFIGCIWYVFSISVGYIGVLEFWDPAAVSNLEPPKIPAESGLPGNIRTTWTLLLGGNHGEIHGEHLYPAFQEDQDNYTSKMGAMGVNIFIWPVSLHLYAVQQSPRFHVMVSALLLLPKLWTS